MAKENEPEHVTNSRPAYPTLYCAVWPDLVPLAKELGYALMVHGSLARDLDLVAVPWVEEASDPAVLAEAIRAKFDSWTGVAKLDETTCDKPHGRMGCLINLGGHAVIDLSIMPRK